MIKIITRSTTNEQRSGNEVFHSRTVSYKTISVFGIRLVTIKHICNYAETDDPIQTMQISFQHKNTNINND